LGSHNLNPHAIDSNANGALLILISVVDWWCMV
jgi:hypothetical protein